MLFAFFCIDKPDHLEVRKENRPAHIAYLESYGERIQGAGPTFADDERTMNGSLIILDLTDRAEADAFVANDPYGKAGLFESVYIRPWKRIKP